MIESHNHPRFVAGRDRLAMVIKQFLTKNSLTHSQLHDFYVWAEPETPTWLANSQISTLRNSKLPKPGPQIFDAIGMINLRLAQLAGDDSPMVRDLPERPPLPAQLRHLIDNAWFMRNPHNGLAMDSGDFFRLYCGRLEMEGTEWEEPTKPFSDDDAIQLSKRFAVWAQRWMVSKEMIPLEAREVFLAAYPLKDKKRQDRCWDVALGRVQWTGKQLSEERDALRFLIGQHERGSTLNVRELDRWASGQSV